MSAKDYPLISFACAADFEAWLAHHGESTPEGIWLRFYKKASGIPSLSYDEAVDIALCFGWIDGLKNSHDEQSYKLRFLPRRPKSVWSRVNTGRAERLIKEGKMRAAGLAQVESAKADGRWERAYHSASTATVPDDLRQALAHSPTAEAFFATLNSANRYAILYRLQDAKRPETRERRLRQFIEMLERGERLH